MAPSRNAVQRAHALARTAALPVVLAIIFVLGATGCTGGSSTDDTLTGDAETTSTASAGIRRYSAEWLIDTTALDMDTDVRSPYLYREVVDDRSGSYLAESPTHLAVQGNDEVVLCAAVTRLPLDPYCATAPRAEGTPNVLAFPLQLIRRDWSPSGVYDLASYREVSLVAATEPGSWQTQITTSTSGFPVECFLVIGETNAANRGFEICFTNDDLRLVASVDLQNDFVYEVDLLRYDRTSVVEDLVTGLEDFYENRPSLHEQLLALYPEIPAPREDQEPQE